MTGAGGSLHLYFTQMEQPPAEVKDTLTQKGWRVHHLPLRHVEHLDVPVSFEDIDMVLISSKQAARWLLCQPKQPACPLAVVGETTSGLLSKGQLYFEKAPCNAAELVARLRPQLKHGMRLLFLRGERAKDTIPKGLADLDLTEVVVYRTVKILENRSPPAHPAMVYFQAPGTVLDYMEAFKTPPERISAIGMSTAHALEQAGWQVDFQPQRPENVHFAASLPGPQAWGFSPHIST